MAQVAISLKIMPESPEIDLEKLKEKIAKKLKVQDAKIEPLAFGLKQLKMLIIAPEKSGTEEIENTIRSIEGVKTVEIESVTLL